MPEAGVDLERVTAAPRVPMDLHARRGRAENNTAERALQHAVIWRRTSGGTDSRRFRTRAIILREIRAQATSLSGDRPEASWSWL